MTHILIIEEINPADDNGNEWQHKWIRMVKKLNPSDDIPEWGDNKPDADKISAWIQRTMLELSKKKQYMELFENFKNTLDSKS